MSQEPAVWREGDRIRQADGCGYGDFVADGVILAHIGDDLDRICDPTISYQFALRSFNAVFFARAVLRLRESERLASTGADTNAQGAQHG